MDEKNVLVPYVVERTSSGERTYDLYSRLLDDRIVFLSGEINDAVANTVVAQLIYLGNLRQKYGRNHHLAHSFVGIYCVRLV